MRGTTTLSVKGLRVEEGFVLGHALPGVDPTVGWVFQSFWRSAGSPGTRGADSLLGRFSRESRQEQDVGGGGDKKKQSQARNYARNNAQNILWRSLAREAPAKERGSMLCGMYGGVCYCRFVPARAKREVVWHCVSRVYTVGLVNEHDLVLGVVSLRWRN